MKTKTYNLDPDFRKDPPNGPYCARCQKPLRGKAKQVTINWDTWEVTEGGKERIGTDCWKKISRG